MFFNINFLLFPYLNKLSNFISDALLKLKLHSCIDNKFARNNDLIFLKLSYSFLFYNHTKFSIYKIFTDKYFIITI